jgi:hypothetical protein
MRHFAAASAGATAWRRRLSDALRRSPDFYADFFAQRLEGCFDLIEAGAVAQIEQPIDICLGNAQTAGQFRFAHT